MLSLRFSSLSATGSSPSPPTHKSLYFLPKLSTNCSVLLLPPKFPRPLKIQKLAAAAGGIVAEEEDKSISEGLPDGLNPELMPKHIAVIMDGNVRWAQRGLQSSAGHEAGGVRYLRELVGLCCKWNIRVLTVFAFSYDNWIRPQLIIVVEVNFLMSLFGRGIKSELDKFIRGGIRISVIGDSSKLPTSLRKLISDAEEATKDNTDLQLIVAVSYSGKCDIIQTRKSIANKAKDGLIQVDDFDESLIEKELETNCTEFLYPDLLIRTSGELRVSNFFLWQLALH